MHITDHTLTLDEHTLHWYQAGDTKTIPTVLLHGGGGTGRAFLHQLEYLSSRGLFVMAPDMPGFGQSDWFPSVQQMQDIRAVLFPWLDHLGIDRLVLGGNSMGGRVAMSMASHSPERVAGLIILDSVGKALPDVPIINPLTIPPAHYTEGLVFDKNRYKERTPYRTLDDARELNRGRKSFAQYLEGDQIQPDPELDLARLTMPSLLIWGREDHIVPLAYGKALDRDLRHSELLVIDQCGHLPHIEEADVVNHAIMDFLDRQGLR